MSFFDRLSNGWTIAMNSFRVLRANKQLLIFPILSGISILLIIGSFVVTVLAANGWDVEEVNYERSLAGYALMFGFYIVNYLVITFFNMALVHCTHLYFRGEEASVEAGIRFSMGRIRVIMSWALFAATVGMILKVIQENTGIVGKIITGILGVAWSIATFFTVPVIAYENLGPIDAFRRSTQLMREKWGESLGARFSFGIINLIGLLALAALFGIGALINPFLGITLAVAGFFLLMTVLSAVRTIFISAVYHNVTGDPVQHFDQQLVDSLFQQK